MKLLSNNKLLNYIPPDPNEKPSKEPPDTNNPPKDNPAKSPPREEEPTTEKPIKEPPASFSLSKLVFYSEQYLFMNYLNVLT